VFISHCKPHFLRQLFHRVILIKPVSNVCMSVRSTKSFFYFSEIWHVGRGRRVKHYGMQYDAIQGQGNEPFKVVIRPFFKSYLLHSLKCELATDDRFLNFKGVRQCLKILVSIISLFTVCTRHVSVRLSVSHFVQAACFSDFKYWF